jgi:hypothetical protein
MAGAEFARQRGEPHLQSLADTTLEIAKNQHHRLLDRHVR